MLRNLVLPPVPQMFRNPAPGCHGRPAQFRFCPMAKDHLAKIEGESLGHEGEVMSAGPD